MKEVILGYIIVQLFTTAFGLAVIESVRPLVIQALEKEGYIKNKNSLYNFSYAITNVLKGFIPFYYLIKSLSIIANKDHVESQVKDLIESKAYVRDDSIIEINNEEETVDSVFKDDLSYGIEFEKPEKYTARKNNLSLYKTYETPVEYEEIISTKEDNLELSPFINNDKVVEQVVVKDDVTNKDIAKAICNLNLDELKALKNKIETLQLLKSTKKELKLEKETI